MAEVAAEPLSAVALRDRMVSGAIRAEAVAETCLQTVAKREPDVQAWAWLDGEHVLTQAKALDAARMNGRPLGPLHGLPVALKDVIDTAGIPTENGTPIDSGRTPDQDATLVSRLKAAGAVIMGKATSTELAFMHPSKTRNPHDPAHTPGGSSSGSAAAVAAGMTPLGVGTQTGGSVVRPAAFCGVVGYKPSFGAISRAGVLKQSQSLDTMGVFANGVADAALIADALFGYDPADPATRPDPAPRLFDTATADAPVTPTFAFVRPPGFDDADPQTVEALRELTAFLGEYCFEAPLPNAFDEAADIRRRINFAEMAKNFYSYETKGRDLLSEEMQAALDEGKDVLARDYIAALDWPGVLNAGLAAIFERCDAILAPAAPGPAPRDHGTTGDAIFNGLWTLCGVPAITLPLLESEAGMPMGVQLIGPRGGDARLLRTARWLEHRVSAEREEQA